MELWTRERMTRTIDLLTGENNCTEAVLGAEGTRPWTVVGVFVVLPTVVLRGWWLLAVPLFAVAGCGVVVLFTTWVIVARTGDTVTFARVPLLRRGEASVLVRVGREAVTLIRRPLPSPGHGGHQGRLKLLASGHAVHVRFEHDERVAYILGRDLG